MKLRSFEVSGHHQNQRLPRTGLGHGDQGGSFIAFVDVDHPHFRPSTTSRKMSS